VTTDTSEKGLESLIVESLVKDAGYRLGHSKDYDRDHAVDLAQLQALERSERGQTREVREVRVQRGQGPERSGSDLHFQLCSRLA
jgi:type I restriction enzyme R subunit